MGNYQARRNSNNNPEEVPEKTEQEQKQESTEKAVDLAAETALDYFTGGQGSKIKNAAGKIPVVGNAVNKTWDNAVKKVSGVVSKTPAGDMLKAADASGLTDTARTAKNAMNMSKGGSTGGANKSNLDNKGVSKNSSVGKSSGGSSVKKSGDSFNLSNFKMPGFSLKTKLIIIGGTWFFSFLIFFMLIAGKDNENLELTNNSSMPARQNLNNIQTNNLNGGSGTILENGESLLSKLGQGKIDELNNKLKTDAQNAGYGTGMAPATVAYDLVKDMLDLGIVVPYLWGGGHGTVSDGINPNWGESKTVTADGSNLQPIGSSHPDGLDCSGFVSWALKNGGCTNFTPILAADFMKLGPHINVNSLITGDIIAKKSHVMIVLSNDGTNINVAEAKSAKYGIIFSSYTYYDLVSENYYFISMKNYYAENCKG